MISRIVRLLSVMLIGASLVACAKLPSVESNQLGPEIVTNDKHESIYYSPAGPSEGVNQESIIRGFLYAGNGPQNDYAIAREYLTVNFSSKWDPASETLIQSGPIEIVSNTGTKIRVLVNFDAKVNADGTYQAMPGSSRILEYRLLQENGEWRITSAPHLTSLLSPNFGVLFKSIPIYFWDKSFAYLVPDLRWFPTKASLPTKLTNALIFGPTQWLAPAVQNIFPSGTKLNINSVTVDSETAAIDFNAAVLKIPEWKRPYLRSQLSATLGGVEGISKVSISVERTVQNISLGSSGISTAGSALPVVLTKDGLHHLAGASLLAIQDTQKPLQAQLATKFLLSSDESIMVLMGNRSIYSYNLGLLSNESQLIDSRNGDLKATIDPFKNIWSTTNSPGAFIRVTESSGLQLKFRNPLGKKVVVRSLAISAEGSRLVIVHDPIFGRSVDIFAVIRDKNRKVIGFGPALPVADFGNDVKAVSWVDSTTLTGIGQGVLGEQVIVDVSVGGTVTMGAGTVNAVSTVTQVGGNKYYLDSSGTLYVSGKQGWERLRSDVLDLRMAGQ